MMNRNDMRSGDHAFRAAASSRSGEKAELLAEINRIEAILMTELTQSMRSMYQGKLRDVRAQYAFIQRGAI